MIYLEFQQKLTEFALKLLELNLNKLKQKQIITIKTELSELIIEAKELEKFFVSTEDNDIMYKLTCENITSFIDVLNSTVKRIDDIQDDNLKVIITQVNELI